MKISRWCWRTIVEQLSSMASPHLQMQLEWSSVPLNLMKSGGRWQILWLSLWQEYHAKAGHWGLVQVNSIRWEFYDADTIHYKNRPPDAFYVRAPTEHSWCAAAFECYQCMLRWLLKSSGKKNALLPSSKKKSKRRCKGFWASVESVYDDHLLPFVHHISGCLRLLRGSH